MSKTVLGLLFSLVLHLVLFPPASKAGWGMVDYKLPTKVANHPSFSYKDSLFVLAGSTTTVTDIVYHSFFGDNALSEWDTNSENIPKNLFWHSSAIENSFIYVLGGNEYPNNQVYSTNAVFKGYVDDRRISNWRSVYSLPEASADGAAVVLNEKLYYSGGATWSIGISSYSSKIFYSQLLEDGGLSSWSDAGQLPARLLGHQLINTGKKLYLLGGYNADLGTSTGEIYEAVMNSDGKITNWIGPLTNTFPDPNYKSYNFMATVVGNFVVVAGGRGPNLHDPHTYNQVFYSPIQTDGSLGPWQKSNFDLPQPTCCAGIATVGSNIFITGGHNGSTGEYFDSVWQINISDLVLNNTPTPTPTTAPPAPTPTSIPVTTKPLVIFIPGMFASWNYEALMHGKDVENEKWKIPQFIDIYDEFIKSLESVGYELNENLWVYNYDWRKSVINNGRDLTKFVSEKVLAGKPNDVKVTLVGHSMGGLVARAAVDQSLATRISKIVTFGTPHFGAAISYPVWEGADFSDFSGLQSVLLRSYLRVNSIFFDNDILAIHSLVPSIQNLLPARNFLKNKKGVDIPLANMVWKNNVTQELNSRLIFQKGLLHTFAGNNKNTVAGYWVDTAKGKTQYRQWLDGKPFSIIYSIEGDGTVMSSDAVIPGAAGIYKLEQTDHGETITKKQPLNSLLELLGVSHTDRIEKNKYKLYDKALVLMAGSPISFNLKTPSADIILPEEDLILVNDPEPGEYEVRLNTIAAGTYTFYFGRINKSDEAWEEYRGVSTRPGQTINLKYQVNMDSASLGAKPQANMQERLKNLLSELSENKKYLLIRTIISPQVKGLLNLVGQIEKYKSDGIKITLAKATETYLDKLIEVVKNYPTMKLNAESKMDLLYELRLIRQDLRQFIQDVDLFPN